MGINALWTAIVLHGANCVLATCLICRPVAAAWDTNVDGKCGNQVVAYFAFEVLGALLDTMVLAVPFPRLYQLQMAWRRRATIALLFSVGALYVVFFLGSLAQVDRV